MNKYKQYKDVDFLFLKQIPSHWNLKRNKFIFQHKIDISGEQWKNYNILSLSTNGIVVKPKDDLKNKGRKPANFAKYQIINQNDFVLCLFDLDLSAVFSDVSNYNGIISATYDAFVVKNGFVRYYKYLFDYLFRSRTLQRFSKNVRYSITVSSFLSLYSLFPPLQEQIQISKFLDWKINEINKIIDKKQKHIQLLDQLSKSLINEVVTGQIDVRDIDVNNINDIYI
ncbi:hypothetical protein ACR82Z_04700 [Mycoplasma sp. 6243]|uniref:hypothetical protein n=1 Tax=Mycoplasma sp. 6243 TaxID=3440865 RepID=UPI003EBFE4A9